MGRFASVALFAVYFNFLRPHASLEASVPVVNPELDVWPNMPSRWIKLMQLSEEYISSCA